MTKKSQNEMKIKKIAKVILIFTAINFTACSERPKTADELFTEATSNLKAGRIDQAETLLQQAIMIDGSGNFLKGQLIDLYINSKQWDKLESYLAINHRKLSWLEKTNGYWALASNHFNNKNWSQSANFYLKTAEAYETLDGAENNKVCMHARPESLRNAAAAHYNNRNYNGIIEAMEKLKDMNRDTLCQEAKANQEVVKNLKEVDGMARMMIIKSMN